MMVRRTSSHAEPRLALLRRPQMVASVMADTTTIMMESRSTCAPRVSRVVTPAAEERDVGAGVTERTNESAIRSRAYLAKCSSP